VSKIPFEKQHLPADLVLQVERDIALGNSVTGSDLLAAIEQSIDLQLAARLRDIVSKSSIPAVKRRGRPSRCKGREDFALAEVDDRYPALLRKHEEEAEQKRLLAAAAGDILASAERTPSELAYTDILNLRRMKRVFRNLDWQTLRNKHSEWKNGHWHSAENSVDSEDFDAD